MNTGSIDAIISIVVLALIAVLLFFISKHKEKKFTQLAGIAFGFILAGLLLGESRLIGYGLIGFGVLLAIVDIILHLRKKPPENRE